MTRNSRLLGPLELTRRQKVLVWDDEIQLTEENIPVILNGPGSSNARSPASPHHSLNVLPIFSEPRSRRSQSVSDFPPPMRRVSTEFTGAQRPVSFSAKFSRVHPATTGVTVLEHMERLDAVEAGLKRLGVEEESIDEEEVDVGTVRTKSKKRETDSPAQVLLSPSARSDYLPAVLEDEVATEGGGSDTEEDLVAMSKSMPHLEQSPPILHARWTSHEERPNLDWMDVDSATSPKRRTVIAEVSISLSPLGQLSSY